MNEIISLHLTNMTTSLLSTKTFIPSTRQELVARSRLIQRLNEVVHRKLTLISAPAGFGKTTLVGVWINNINQGDQSKYKIGWLSLDENDNDQTRFLTYLIVSINSIEGISPSFGEDILTQLQSPQPPVIDVLLTELVNEITVFSSNVILILDDYHLIEDQSIHDTMSFLLDNLPPQLHIVITTREDPPFSLSRLRARSQLIELRATDLRFTVSETTQFLNDVMGLALGDEEIAALEARTEGWITGLQMAALSMRGRTDTANFIQAFTGSHHFILDYLIEEVLQNQPDHIRNFLLQTSILDRLCGSLCDAVSTQPDGKLTLEKLERDNLFVVPLDDQRQWYRYHHLFADVLQTNLREQQPDQVATLHTRASEWYSKNGLPAEAVHHALATEDFERAADIAELAWPDWKESFYSIAWLGWIRNLPVELVRSRPVLCVNFAWAHLNAGELEAAEARLQDVERWIGRGVAPRNRSEESAIVDENQLQELPITLAAGRAYHAQAVGNLPATVKYAQQVLELLPDSEHPEWGTATALLGLSQWASGEIEAAHDTLANGLAAMKPLDVIIGTFVLAEMKLTLGHIHEAVLTCEHAFRLAAEHGEPMPIGTEDVYSGLAELHREMGDLEAAAQDLARCKELGKKIELPDWQYRYAVAQARLYISLGDLDSALQRLDEAEQVFVRTPLPIIHPIPALKARVWIKQGELEKAASWARQQNLSMGDELSYLHEFEHITLARLLIAQNQAPAAIELLVRLWTAAKNGNRIGSVIEILVLLAIANQTQDNDSAAFSALEQALTIAAPPGLVQVFVDESSAIGSLIYEALSQGIQPKFVKKIIEAVQLDDPKTAKPALGSEWIEPLSNREIEVLQLIAEGLTNQEIAAQLYITLNTVKGHTRNIFAKMGVKNRTKAVAKGKILGILNPE